jgi:hypothetical protein
LNKNATIRCQNDVFFFTSCLLADRQPGHRSLRGQKKPSTIQRHKELGCAEPTIL